MPTTNTALALADAAADDARAAWVAADSAGLGVLAGYLWQQYMERLATYKALHVLEAAEHSAHVEALQRQLHEELRARRAADKRHLTTGRSFLS